LHISWKYLSKIRNASIIIPINKISINKSGNLGWVIIEFSSSMLIFEKIVLNLVTLYSFISRLRRYHRSILIMQYSHSEKFCIFGDYLFLLLFLFHVLIVLFNHVLFCAPIYFLQHIKLLLCIFIPFSLIFFRFTFIFL
jgi:hypothetical protein